jgi:hypothetical protein
MCIIIDINVWAHIFNKQDINHKNFIHVYDWIEQKQGKIVYGGSRYIKELGETKRRILLEYNKKNQVFFINSDLVDKETKRLNDVILHRDFNDQHILALCVVSGCQLICSKDELSYKFLKDRKLQKKRGLKIIIPKIYKNPKHKDKLCRSTHRCLKCNKIKNRVNG